MAEIIEFPHSNQVPNYTGRLLVLNPEKARRFQCGGMVLGPKHMYDVVTPTTQMAQVQRALEAGILLDITDEKAGVKTKHSRLSAVQDSDTSLKAYIGPKSVFRDLDLAIFADITPEDMALEETVCVFSSDPEEQKRIEAAMKLAKPLLDLPPGMDDPDKYALKLDTH